MQTSQSNLNKSLQRAIDRVLIEFDIQPTPEFHQNIVLYFSLLYHWNQRINLTGIRQPSEMVYRHLGDTMLLIKVFPPEGIRSLLDIGTGAGIPGLLVKILKPEIEVVLVDRIRKKVSFLKNVIIRLGIQKVFVQQGEVGRPGVPEIVPTGGFDIIVSRAVGDVFSLCKMAIPYISEHGTIIAMKGPRARDEIERIWEKLRKYEIDIEIKEENLPVLGHKRTFVLIKRVNF